jgi:hypothetical protein
VIHFCASKRFFREKGRSKHFLELHLKKANKLKRKESKKTRKLTFFTVPCFVPLPSDDAISVAIASVLPRNHGREQGERDPARVERAHGPGGGGSREQTTAADDEEILRKKSRGLFFARESF